MYEIKSPRDYSVLLRKPGDGLDAWGTSAGINVFSILNAELARLTDGTVVVLDYSGIERTDVSFQREGVVETVKRHRPRLLFIASNVGDEDVLANLGAALEARGETLLVRNRGGLPRILGRRLAKEHEDTLWAVHEHPGFTSTQLTVPPYGLEGSAASARLTALWKAGLLSRIQGASPSGGREYRYHPIR